MSKWLPRALPGAAAEQGIDVVLAREAKQLAVDAGLPERQADAVAADYPAALLDGMKWAMFTVGVFALLASSAAGRMPCRRLTGAREPAVEPAGTA